MPIGPGAQGVPGLLTWGGSGVGADDAPGSGGGDPHQDAGEQVVQGPAVALFGAVVEAAQQCQVAWAGGSALVVGQGVVAVGAGGRLPAGGEPAGGVPVVD